MSYVNFPGPGRHNGRGGGGGGIPQQMTGEPTQFIPYGASGPIATGPMYAGLPPGSPTGPATAYLPVGMGDGTTTMAPMATQYVNGHWQWAPANGQMSTSPGATSNRSMPSPNGLQSMLQQQMTGYSGQQSYGDMYRSANDVDVKRSSKGSKKAREWEKEQRAREEAEEKFRVQSDIINAQADRDRQQRERRLSIGASLQPAQSMNDLNRRFNSMAMAPPAPTTGLVAPGSGAYARPRGLSVSEQDRETVTQNPYGSTRSRRVSVSQGNGDGARESIDYSTSKVRTRKMSNAAQNPYSTPGSTLGNFYDDAPTGAGGNGLSVGKSPYVRPGSLPPGAFVGPDGRVMVPNPALMSGQNGMPLVPQMTGGAGATSLYNGVGGGAAGGMYTSPGGGAGGRIIVPSSFYREPNRSAQYTRFSPFTIIWDLNELKQFTPPLPALLVPNDVMHEDWNRCISDVAQSWSGIFPYNLWPSQKNALVTTNKAQTSSSFRPNSAMMSKGRTTQTTMRPSSAVARTVDIWNISFFHDRGLELVLYRGLERRTGETAGSRMERMKMDLVPPQYQRALMGMKKRRPPVTPLGQQGRRPTRGRDSSDEEDDDDEGFRTDESSLTSSSESSSSSSEDEDEDLDDDEENEQNPYSKYKSAAPRSRRNSMAGGMGVDPYERWAKKSKLGWKMIEKRQKLQRKRRKLERRQRRQMMREEPLYSVWMSCRDA